MRRLLAEGMRSGAYHENVRGVHVDITKNLFNASVADVFIDDEVFDAVHCGLEGWQWDLPLLCDVAFPTRDRVEGNIGGVQAAEWRGMAGYHVAPNPS